MSAPTLYTEVTLAEFMVVELGGIADALGWDSAALRVEHAVHDVARALSVPDEAEVTDTTALVASARVAIWRAARAALADRYRFSTDGQAFERQQLWDHADRMVIDAEQQAAALGVGSAAVISIDPINRNQDPYGPSGSIRGEFSA